MSEEEDVYFFYQDKKVILALRESVDYTTSYKYKWCSNELLKVSKIINSGIVLVVCGRGLTIKIENQNDLETWIRCVFDIQNIHSLDMLAKEWI